jgi:DNA (cytosine-5)-methyltransferase 1
MNCIDLFCGCGGMTLGFKWAGFNSIIASDIDENCGKTIEKNFPETKFILGNISDVDKAYFDEIIKNKEIDLITGGPPCQGFSLANKNRNKVEDDPRNKLFYDYVKFIKWYSPKAFVMENVKGLLSMEKGKVIQTILEEFENAGLGYNVDYKVLTASDYGVPQKRERVILIGFRKDLNLFPEFPEENKSIQITVDEAILDLPEINAGQGKENADYISEPMNDYQKLMRKNSKKVFNHIAMRHTQRLIDRFEAIKPGKNLIDVWETHGAVKRGNPNEKSEVKFSQNNLRLIGNKPAPTVAASFQSNFIHPYLNRNFTAREGARFQSFPDDFIFEGMRTKMSWEKGLSQYQQIGNAVPPLMAKAVADKIKDVLTNGNSTEYLNKLNIKKHKQSVLEF